MISRGCRNLTWTAMWTPATRRQHSRDKLRYETDLTDAEWSYIEPLSRAFTSRACGPARGVSLASERSRISVRKVCGRLISPLSERNHGRQCRQHSERGAALLPRSKVRCPPSLEGFHPLAPTLSRLPRTQAIVPRPKVSLRYGHPRCVEGRAMAFCQRRFV